VETEGERSREGEEQGEGWEEGKAVHFLSFFEGEVQSTRAQYTLFLTF